MRTKDLSDRQRSILNFCRNYYDTFGIVPTIREIMKGCNVTSTSVARHNLLALEKHGYLMRYERTARGYVLKTVKGRKGGSDSGRPD